MGQTKKRVVIICPGRGSYTQKELGYLSRFGGEQQRFIQAIDDYRVTKGQLSVSEMDSADKFSVRLHTPGENASVLIYACALIDFMNINRDKYEIVAITGNSMGWYLALAFAGALEERAAFEVINTMGSMMKDRVIGGQIIYPIVDDEWRYSRERSDVVTRCMEEVNRDEDSPVYPSIYLGGYLVIGGDDSGLRKLSKLLPSVDETYPLRLVNHAAFHTPLLHSVSEQAFAALPEKLFKRPEIPLVDGRGHIWQPYSTSTSDLRNYTLGHQVVAPFHYSRAVEVCLKEFAPDNLVLLGPGASLGGSTAQILIANDWLSLKNKQAFKQLQENKPFLLAMGLDDQRSMVIG